MLSLSLSQAQVIANFKRSSQFVFSPEIEAGNLTINVKKQKICKEQLQQKIINGWNEEMDILTRKVHHTPLLPFIIKWVLQNPRNFVDNVKSDNDKTKLKQLANFIPSQESTKATEPPLLNCVRFLCNLIDL